MNPKRKKKLVGRDARHRKLQNRHEARHAVSVAPFDPRREADYIAECAARRDARIVSIGVLIFFSTDSGDAWMLDAEDSRANCLARDRDPEPVTILETASKISIVWTGHFAIEAALATIQARLAGQ